MTSLTKIITPSYVNFDGNKTEFIMDILLYGVA